MSTASSLWLDTGLEVVDFREFAGSRGYSIHAHDAVAQLAATQKLARAFVDQPETILQELVNAAVELCGADSAGISIEKEDRTDTEFYHWVATAGDYNGFLGAVLPRWPSACGICLERGRPQLFRVGKKFFDIMGITAPLVTDGILLPWEVGEIRGTIFIMAHQREEAFDLSDCRVMEILADFAAMGVRHRLQQKQLMEKTAVAAAAAMANKLAHRINNPLQSLTNVLYLASVGHNGEEAKIVGQQALGDLSRLSELVTKLLALRYGDQD